MGAELYQPLHTPQWEKWKCPGRGIFCRPNIFFTLRINDKIDIIKDKERNSFFMSKILRYFVVLFACVVGLLSQPYTAKAYNPSDYYTGLLTFKSKYQDTVPDVFYVRKSDGKLFYLDDDFEMVPFERLNKIPRILLYKFAGFYTGEESQQNIVPRLPIIDSNGYAIYEGGVNDLPMEDYESESYNFYIWMVPDFLLLTPVELWADADTAGTGRIYYLKRISPGGLCGIWLNPYGEDDEEPKIVRPMLNGDLFMGFFDKEVGGVQWIDSDGKFTDSAQQVICDNNSSTVPDKLYAQWCRNTSGYMYYTESGECKPCPSNPNSDLYDFVKGDGTGIENCALRLNVSKSNCGVNTNVVYQYNASEGKYKLVTDTVDAEAGFYGGANPDLTKDRCEACPRDSSVSDLYDFVKGNGTGIESCTLQLNMTKSECGDGTEVVYQYNASENRYKIKTDNVSVILSRYKVIDPDLTKDRCEKCPGLDQYGNWDLYDFIENDHVGPESCKLKLNLDKSACGGDTNVVYNYDKGSGDYVLDTRKLKIIPDDDKFVLRTEGYIYDDDDNLLDFCTSCSRTDGKYINAKSVCFSCPTTQNTGCLNCESLIGSDNLFTFQSGSDPFVGIDACAIQLNVGPNGKSSCGAGTSVVYKYDSLAGKYIRSGLYVEAGTGNRVLDNLEMPGPEVLGDYCGYSCKEDWEHYVNGKCVPCRNGYYWDQDMCKKCPAGFACPDEGEYLTEPIPCGVDTFSEGGQPSCTGCAAGYTTLGDTDWCLADGLQCTSRNACKKKSGTAKLCLDAECTNAVTFVNGTVKILSTNRSVIKNK